MRGKVIRNLLRTMDEVGLVRLLPITLFSSAACFVLIITFGNMAFANSQNDLPLRAEKYVHATRAHCQAEKMIDLIGNGLDANAKVNGTSLIFTALSKGADDCALVLLKYGANINSKTPYGNLLDFILPTAAGANSCSPNIVDALLKRGANPNMVWFDTTPLLSASAAKNLFCAKRLIEAGAKVNFAVGPQGLTPLMVAQLASFREDSNTKRGLNERLGMTRLLLANGADPNLKMQGEKAEGQTALFMATGLAYPNVPCSKCARLIIKSGGKPSVIDSKGNTPLLWALKSKHNTNLRTIKVLVEGGVDVDLANAETGETPLMAAAARGSEKIVRYLLDHGAKRCARDKQDRNAADYARAARHYDLANLLSK